MAMDGGQMTAMRCTVAAARRCEALDDGPRAAVPTLLELAAGAR
jgi:hypothetical protein